MIEVEGDYIEVNNMHLSSHCVDTLGHTGAQMHMSPPKADHKCGNGHGIVKMANGDTAKK